MKGVVKVGGKGVVKVGGEGVGPAGSVRSRVP